MDDNNDKNSVGHQQHFPTAICLPTRYDVRLSFYADCNRWQTE